VRILNMLSRVPWRIRTGFRARQGPGNPLPVEARSSTGWGKWWIQHHQRLVPVEWTDGGGGAPGSIHVEGYVCAPQQARLRSTHQYFYITAATSKAVFISRSLTQSYDVLPRAGSPMAVLS